MIRRIGFGIICLWLLAGAMGLKAEAADSSIVSRINFSIREYPLDEKRYTEAVDQVYKEAFYRTLTNQLPISYGKKEAIHQPLAEVSYWDCIPTFFRDGLRGLYGVSDEQFAGYITGYEYDYLDFDKDGLPELLVDTGMDGVCLFKYLEEEKRVVEIQHFSSRGCVIGGGQAFEINSFSGGFDYSYRDWETGEEIRFICYYLGDGGSEYAVEYSKGNESPKEWEISQAEWEQTREIYDRAKEQASPRLSYEEVFGDSRIYPGETKAELGQIKKGYEDFLKGQKSLEGIEVGSIPGVEISYALQDMDEDKLPELLLQTEYGFYLFKQNEGECFLCKILEKGNKASQEYVFLKNGKLVEYYRPDSENEEEVFQIHQFAPSGTTIEKQTYKRSDLNRDGIYDERDGYALWQKEEWKEGQWTGGEWKEYSLDEWKEETWKYFHTGKKGKVTFGKEVEWTKYLSGKIHLDFYLLNRDYFGEESLGWFTDSLKTSLFQRSNEVKGSFQEVLPSSSSFPRELILEMEKVIYNSLDAQMEEYARAYSGEEPKTSYFELLKRFGAQDFSLELWEMREHFPGIIEEADNRWEAYRLVTGDENTQELFHVPLEGKENYYLCVTSSGGSNGAYWVSLSEWTGEKFVHLGGFETPNFGWANVIRYGEDYFYVYLPYNRWLKNYDGIRLHRLGEGMEEDPLLIQYLPHGYLRENLYDGTGELLVGELLEAYLADIEEEITASPYLEQGFNTAWDTYVGEEEKFILPSEGGGYERTWYEVDFTNTGILVYLEKTAFEPSSKTGFWHLRTRFYTADRKNPLEMPEIGTGNQLPNQNRPVLVQLWFKEFGEKVYTFGLYHAFDYTYLLNVSLIEGERITRIRTDVLLPERQFILSNAVFHTKG